jgi:hypothetical protein
MNELYYHFYNGEEMIDGSPHAEEDATDAIIWHESDGHMMSFKPVGFGFWQAYDITESFGMGHEHWLNQEFDSMNSALKAVTEVASTCV